MQDQLFFRHIRYLEKGIVTLAIEIKDGWVQYSYSLCSPKDKFSRAWGRAIAEGRLTCPRKRRVSGFKLDHDLATKGTRAILDRVEQHFLAAVYKKEDWIINCKWLRRSVDKLTASTEGHSLISFIRTFKIGGETNEPYSKRDLAGTEVGQSDSSQAHP